MATNEKGEHTPPQNIDFQEWKTMRLNYYRFPESTNQAILDEYECTPDDNVIGCSVTFAKQMLKKYGGSAWTEHIDRSGSCFEVTEIKLRGNNSRFKYNHHL